MCIRQGTSVAVQGSGLPVYMDLRAMDSLDTKYKHLSRDYGPMSAVVE